MFSGILSSRGHSPSPARAWLVLCAMSMLQFFIAVDVTVVNIALPSIGADFDVDGHILTWVVVGYTVTGGGLLMLGGRLSDLLGRRRVLLLGTALFGTASLLAGLAPTFALLVVARLLQGAGEAIALPAAMATIVLMFPDGPRRSRALSVWAAVASCGLVLGFVLSGIITAHLGWRWIFLVSVPFILIVLLAAVFLVEGDRPVAQDAPPLDLPGVLLLTACPLLFTFGVVEAGEPATPAWVVPGALAGAVAAGAGFVRVEARSRNPLLPLHFLAHRTRVAANLATMLLSGGLSTSFLLFTFYLQDRLGIGPLGAGLTMLPLALSLIVFSMLVPRLLGRWGARACVLAGIGFTAAAMAAIALVSVLQAGSAAMIPAMLLIAAGMGFGIVGLQYVAVSGVTEEDAGVASGIQRAADQLGGATGVAVCVGIGFTPTLHSFDPFLVATLLAAGGLVTGAVVAWRMPAPVPAADLQEQAGGPSPRRGVPPIAKAAHPGGTCWSTSSPAERRSRARPALLLTDPLWDQFQALLPKREAVAHPLGCHRPRIPDQVVFDKLLARLVLGGTYQQHADHTCSATTMRAPRDEWIAVGAFERLHQLALEAYDEAIGLDLENLVVDGCIVKAPGGGQNTGRSPVDRGKSGLKRSVLVDGGGLPLGWVLVGANRNDSPLLRPTLETLRLFGFRLPPSITVHLDTGYDSQPARALLEELGCAGRITPKGQFVPINHTHRWVVERTNSWHNRGFKALSIVTDRRAVVQDAWVALASAVIVIRRLLRRAWTAYRWDARPARRP